MLLLTLTWSEELLVVAVVAAEVAELEKQEERVVLHLHLHTLEEEEESAECSIKGDEVKPSIPVQAMASVSSAGWVHLWKLMRKIYLFCLQLDPMETEANWTSGQVV